MDKLNPENWFIFYGTQSDTLPDHWHIESDHQGHSVCGHDATASFPIKFKTGGMFPICSMCLSQLYKNAIEETSNTVEVTRIPDAWTKKPVREEDDTNLSTEHRFLVLVDRNAMWWSFDGYPVFNWALNNEYIVRDGHSGCKLTQAGRDALEAHRTKQEG